MAHAARGVRRAVVLLGLLAGGLVAGGCERRHLPPPESPAPHLQHGVDAVPADLDVVVRVDLVSAKRAFGAEVTRALSVRTMEAGSDEPTEAFVDAVLARADTLWIAVRPGLAATSTDNVLVARGRFAGIEPPRGEGADGWGIPLDLGADVRLYERDPPTRAAPARLYAASSDFWVLASEAEIDSVERAVERGQAEGRLAPPERGTLSVAARVPALLRAAPPGLSRLARLTTALEAATELYGHVSVDQSGLSSEVEIHFVEEADARAATEAVAALRATLSHLPGTGGLVARALREETVARMMVLRLSLPPEQVGEIAACLTAGDGC